MFENSVITARVAAQRRLPLLAASFAIHSAAVIAIIVASISSQSFPTQSPDEVRAVFLPTAPVIPPPLGSRNASRTAAPPQHHAHLPQPAATAPDMTTPAVVPDSITPAQTTTAGDPSTTVGTGISSMPYGDPNGTPDGIDIGQPVTPGAPPATPEITYRPGGEVRAARVLQRVEPEYPRIAIATRLRGMVVVQCVIDKSGQVRDAQVVRSSSALFDKAALDAVQRWKFAPGVLHDHPVDTYFELTITFALN